MQDKPQGNNINEIRSFWNKFAPIYETTDPTPQTFYYTLINMLDLQHAKHILEVACGTGRLIHQAMTIKPLETTYLATDLSPVMIDYSKKTLAKYIQKVGVQGTVEEFMKRHHLEIREVNGEEKLDVQYKFDRIIGNLVIHTTEDPAKMMKNFHDMAEEGCLLALSVWGSPDSNLLFSTLIDSLRSKANSDPNGRTPFHLYGKLKELGEQTGWVTVLQWSQSAPWSFYGVDDTLKQLIRFQSQDNEEVVEDVCKQLEEKVFKEKKALSFGGQCIILRKK